MKDVCEFTSRKQIQEIPPWNTEYNIYECNIKHLKETIILLTKLAEYSFGESSDVKSFYQFNPVLKIKFLY